MFGQPRALVAQTNQKSICKGDSETNEDRSPLKEAESWRVHIVSIIED
jgi:hypothetical protein